MQREVVRPKLNDAPQGVTPAHFADDFLSRALTKTPLEQFH
jgi:hypothetical protein